MSDTKQTFISHAKRVLDIEADAIVTLKEIVNDNFMDICSILKSCQGRVVVTGMGKSGHIGHKIAATFASTGTPSFFMHPAEASHGDLGMITANDVVLALSNSGETDELLAILPHLVRQNIPLIAITGNEHSTLAKMSTFHLYAKIKEEACPLGLAPTASTTAALALGDALAVTLLEMRGFTSDDFARSHPGGKLGRRLLLLVEDAMAPLSEIAVLPKEANLAEALIEMTKHPLGMLVITDANEELLGVFTEGDLRRTLTKHQDFHYVTLSECMTKTAHTISPCALAVDAVNMMEKNKITALPVIHAKTRKVVGIINMHHLLKARVI